MSESQRQYVACGALEELKEGGVMGKSLKTRKHLSRAGP